MLSLDGRCKTLDRTADGYVRSEAITLVFLSANSADNMEGYRTLKELKCHLVLGTHVNQDGRTSSLTAPNGPAQQRSIHGALAAALLHPDRLVGVEMHGTGLAASLT